MHLYEDLIAIQRSPKLVAAVRRQDRVLNSKNRRRGIRARRGDGTFGQLVPGEIAILDSDYLVARGSIATVEIGVEVKILFKAMIKQIDRVIGDLQRQVTEFRRGGGNPICVGIVGINQAAHCVGHEGNRAYPTTGQQGFLHPVQEADEAERRLLNDALSAHDEFLIVRFRATNELPYRFSWVDYDGLRLDYAAALARISERYEQRF